MVSRRKFTSEFKSRVVREALKERETLSELSARFEVAPNQISKWKQEALEHLDNVFNRSSSNKELREKDFQIQLLERKVGQLTIERDFLDRACDKLGVSKKKLR